MMVKVTNDCKYFFEKENGNIYIYGAGNAGYWVGYYLTQCGIEYAGYIDKNQELTRLSYNDHPVLYIDKLEGLDGKRIRLIISPGVYKEILGELLWYEHLWNLDILCLIPQYKSISSKDDVYNINKMLGYFRRKLFNGEVPTIISNTCVAGHIYDAMALPLLSPTINVGIKDKDYIKLCNNMKYYMGQELELLNWERECISSGVDTPHLKAKLGDVEIHFAHIESEKGIKERWELLVDRINWNNIIYVMEEQRYRPPLKWSTSEEFLKLNGKKLLIRTKINNLGDKNVIYIPDDWFMVRDEPVLENYFDLVEWLNS